MERVAAGYVSETGALTCAGNVSGHCGVQPLLVKYLIPDSGQTAVIFSE